MTGKTTSTTLLQSIVTRIAASYLLVSYFFISFASYTASNAARSSRFTKQCSYIDDTLDYLALVFNKGYWLVC